VEGAVIGGLALVLGGLAVSGFYTWQGIFAGESENKLWSISNGIESWLYGAGGLIAAAIGTLILLDRFA